MLAVKITVMVCAMSAQISFLCGSGPRSSLRRAAACWVLGLFLPVIGIAITLASPASVLRKPL